MTTDVRLVLPFATAVIAARFRKDANDGTVAVASALSMPIQRQAVHVMGFNESHTRILESEVAALLNATLLRASGAQQ